VNCNGQTRYRIIFDETLDRLEQCPGANTDAKTGSGSRGTALSME
jgi:hypothetical protein